MITPPERIEIEQVLRTLLEREKEGQPRRLQAADIVYREPLGIVLIRPAAEAERESVMLSADYIAGGGSTQLRGMAVATWNLVALVRRLPNSIEDALPGEAPRLIVRPNDVTLDVRHAALQMAMGSGMMASGTPASAVAAAEAFATFLAGESTLEAEPGYVLQPGERWADEPAAEAVEG